MFSIQLQYQHQEELRAGNGTNAPTREQIKKVSKEASQVMNGIETFRGTNADWMSLCQFQDENRGEVHLLARKPFQVIWHTQKQINLASRNDVNSTLYVDGTAGIFPDIEGAPTHYYTVVVKSQGKPPVPVSHFITNR